ncbi:hypothetical protein OBBRIDRAFT_531341 [Obba rivulosa]|uniref:Uncharacterized protein n=1 Tax=Obba rivulosa TaxID=1052685 RepID=A0A8E2DNS9_9APHY|nr:hypothetical protein OBBRIDRAFT_531341 [Obba rivulosa]
MQDWLFGDVRVSVWPFADEIRPDAAGQRAYGGCTGRPACSGPSVLSQSRHCWRLGRRVDFRLGVSSHWSYGPQSLFRTSSLVLSRWLPPVPRLPPPAGRVVGPAVRPREENLVSVPGTILPTVSGSQTTSSGPVQSFSLPLSRLSLISSSASSSSQTSPSPSPSPSPTPSSSSTSDSTAAPTPSSPSSSSSASMTSISFRPGPAPTSYTFAFGVMPTTWTTCSEVSIPWAYSGPPQQFSLGVIPNRAPSPDSSASSPGGLIAMNLETDNSPFTWTQVNVPAGTYSLTAVGLAVGSDMPFVFQVLNGSDTSCVASFSSSIPPSSSTMASSPSSSPSSTSAFSGTSSQTSGAGQSSSSTVSSTSSVSSSVTPLPVSDVSTKSHAGAIAGGVIGGVAIIAAAAAAIFFLGLCGRKPTRSRQRAASVVGGKKAFGKWDGLSSRDSGMDTNVLVGGSAGRYSRGKHGQTESSGSMLPMAARDSVIGHNIPPMQVGAGVAGVAPAMFLSREDLSTLTEEDKVSMSSSGHGHGAVVEHAPPTSYYTYRRASGSMPSVPQSVVGFNGSSGSLGRAHTTSTQDRTITLAPLDPGASAHTSLQSSVRGHTSHQSQSSGSFAGDSPTLLSPSSRPRASPMSADMIPLNRSLSSGQRRAARKPVPTYVPTDAEPGSFSTLSSVDSPLYQEGLNLNDSPSGSSSNLHGPQMHSREDLRLPDLNHKSSFGDARPVHYLMPDMPSGSGS